MIPYIRMAAGRDYDILASREHIEAHRPCYTENTDDRYVEYKSLIWLTSLALLDRGCAIMHAVAVMLDGVCWLISAPSGTGKSTQYFNLKRLYGDDVEMICGDMPLLKENEEGKIMVHPSPWNGKERIKGRRPAPLGGILYLRQGSGNTIRRMEAAEAVLPILLQMAVLPDTEEQVKKLTTFTERILQDHPVWEMVNRGDPESSRLAADTFRDHIRNECHEI